MARNHTSIEQDHDVSLGWGDPWLAAKFQLLNKKYLQNKEAKIMA